MASCEEKKETITMKEKEKIKMKAKMKAKIKAKLKAKMKVKMGEEKEKKEKGKEKEEKPKGTAAKERPKERTKLQENDATVSKSDRINRLSEVAADFNGLELQAFNVLHTYKWQPGTVALSQQAHKMYTLYMRASPEALEVNGGVLYPVSERVMVTFITTLARLGYKQLYGIYYQGLSRLVVATGLPKITYGTRIAALCSSFARKDKVQVKHTRPLQADDIYHIISCFRPHTARNARDAFVFLGNHSWGKRGSSLYALLVEHLRFTTDTGNHNVKTDDPTVEEAQTADLGGDSKPPCEEPWWAKTLPGSPRCIATFYVDKVMKEPHTLSLTPHPTASKCPIYAMLKYFQQRGIFVGDPFAGNFEMREEAKAWPVYCQYTKEGVVINDVHLEAKILSQMVNWRAVNAGYPAHTFSAHSLRAGFATDMILNAVKRNGGYSTEIWTMLARLGGWAIGSGGQSRAQELYVNKYLDTVLDTTALTCGLERSSAIAVEAKRKHEESKINKLTRELPDQDLCHIYETELSDADNNLRKESFDLERKIVLLRQQKRASAREALRSWTFMQEAESMLNDNDSDSNGDDNGDESKLDETTIAAPATKRPRPSRAVASKATGGDGDGDESKLEDATSPRAVKRSRTGRLMTRKSDGAKDGEDEVATIPPAKRSRTRVVASGDGNEKELKKGSPKPPAKKRRLAKTAAEGDDDEEAGDDDDADDDEVDDDEIETLKARREVIRKAVVFRKLTVTRRWLLAWAEENYASWTEEIEQLCQADEKMNKCIEEHAAIVQSKEAISESKLKLVYRRITDRKRAIRIAAARELFEAYLSSEPLY